MEQDRCTVCNTVFTLKVFECATGWYVGRACNCDRHTRISRLYKTEKELIDNTFINE